LRNRKHIVCFLTLFCAVIVARAAFTIEPALVRMNMAAGEKVVLADVVNTGKTPIAVALTVFERELDLDGELTKSKPVPSKDFTIYPSEIILYSGKKASVQLMYKGKERIAADKTYTLFSTEVLMPIEEEGVEGVAVNIPMIVSYYTVISLETGKEGKLTFVSSKMIENNMVELIVENRSSGRVSARGLAIKTDTDIIKGLTGTKNSVMPGQKRRFTFKYMRPLTSKEVKFIYVPD